MSYSTQSKTAILGNYYNKYLSTNFIARLLVRHYLKTFDILISKVQKKPRTILDLGCGETYLSRRLASHYPEAEVFAVDISQEILKFLPRASFQYVCSSAQAISFGNQLFDLVVCLETLEHLADPRQAMEEIARVSCGDVLLSAPREPLWRIMNIARGAYIRQCGNTPGHIQHWNKRQFIGFLNNYFHIRQVICPVPWVMALCAIGERSVGH